MKKVVLASLLACAVLTLGLSTAFAQTPVQLGSQQDKPIQMSDAELTLYNNAMNQSDPKAKATGIEAYLTAYPNSAVKQEMLGILMAAYGAVPDIAKALDAADRILQIDPNNLRALYVEALIRKGNADSVTDPAAKQAVLDAAAGYAQKGIAALAMPKPVNIPDADYKALKTAATPALYSTIGLAALNKKDTATAIDAYKNELAFVPVAQTESPNGQLPDVYQLGEAYYQSTPPDLLDCTYYMSRFVAYAPEPYKSQATPLAKYCYKKFHGGDDGYDTIVAAATANLNPPAGLFASIKPAPTPVDTINSIFQSTPDLATLAVSDKEYILQNGTSEQTSKVWATIQGKSVQIPGALVISSSPTVVKVAVTDDAVQSKTADFTFNMAPPEDIPELKANATIAQKAAYKKAVDAAKTKADAIVAATAVGQTVTLTGTYDSFTASPIQIIMKDGVVVLAKAAAKPAAKAAAPAHRAAHK
jgi:tetratricopeptide (TPR) repeat protein